MRGKLGTGGKLKVWRSASEWHMAHGIWHCARLKVVEKWRCSKHFRNGRADYHMAGATASASITVTFRERRGKHDGPPIQRSGRYEADSMAMRLRIRRDFSVQMAMLITRIVNEIILPTGGHATASHE